MIQDKKKSGIINYWIMQIIQLQERAFLYPSDDFCSLFRAEVSYL